LEINHHADQRPDEATQQTHSKTWHPYWFGGFCHGGGGGVDGFGVTCGGAFGRGGGGTNRKCSAKRVFAVAVPSAWHTGQFTVNGIRPPTGSTSNLYF
jgi:hypothetical protein